MPSGFTGTFVVADPSAIGGQPLLPGPGERSDMTQAGLLCPILGHSVSQHQRAPRLSAPRPRAGAVLSPSVTTISGRGLRSLAWRVDLPGWPHASALCRPHHRRSRYLLGGQVSGGPAARPHTPSSGGQRARTTRGRITAREKGRRGTGV